MTELIEAVAAKGEQVTISGFAKFARVDRPARVARNPATGAPVKVKASKKAKITPLKGFKDAVMSASAAPKLAMGVWPSAPKAAVKRREEEAAGVPRSRQRGLRYPSIHHPVGEGGQGSGWVPGPGLTQRIPADALDSGVVLITIRRPGPDTHSVLTSRAE